MKQCKDCSVDLVVGENWRASSKKYGNYKCNQCNSKSAIAYSKNNPESNKKAVKKWVSANRPPTGNPKGRPKTGKPKMKSQYFNAKLKVTIKPGIYAVYNNDEIIYIGESDYPYNRKTMHFSRAGIRGGKIVDTTSAVSLALGRGEIQRDNLTFKIMEFIDDTDTRKAQEKCLIQRYKPLYNEVYL